MVGIHSFIFVNNDTLQSRCKREWYDIGFTYEEEEDDDDDDNNDDDDDVLNDMYDGEALQASMGWKLGMASVPAYLLVGNPNQQLQIQYYHHLHSEVEQLMSMMMMIMILCIQQWTSTSSLSCRLSTATVVS